MRFLLDIVCVIMQSGKHAFLTTMNTQMLLKMMLVFKGFSTLCTLKLPVFDVGFRHSIL